MSDDGAAGQWNCAGFALGILLLVGPLVLAIAGIIEISSIHDVIPEARGGSLFLWGAAMLGGSFAGYFGYVIVGFNFERLPSRPQWLYWVMLLTGILWIPHFGLGTIVGLALLVFTIRQREKFDFGKSDVVRDSMSGDAKVG